MQNQLYAVTVNYEEKISLSNSFFSTISPAWQFSKISPAWQLSKISPVWQLPKISLGNTIFQKIPPHPRGGAWGRFCTSGCLLYNDMPFWWPLLHLYACKLPIFSVLDVSDKKGDIASEKLTEKRITCIAELFVNTNRPQIIDYSASVSWMLIS